MTIPMPLIQHSGSVRATFRMADIENDNNRCKIIKMERSKV